MGVIGGRGKKKIRGHYNLAPPPPPPPPPGMFIDEDDDIDDIDPCKPWN
jgi:hypothetical protein